MADLAGHYQQSEGQIDNDLYNSPVIVEFSNYKSYIMWSKYTTFHSSLTVVTVNFVVTEQEVRSYLTLKSEHSQKRDG